MGAPVLSIVIPTYNRSEFLSRALFSIVQQSFLTNEIEVLVSDNCSQDDTPEILEKYRTLFPCRFFYSRNLVNYGSSYNIIKLMKESKGRFTLVLGDDDALVNGSIAKLIYLLKRYPEAGLFSLGTKGLTIINNCDLDYYSSEGLKYIKFFSNKKFLNYINVNISFTSSIIYNSAVLEKNFLDQYQGSNLPNIAVILKLITENYSTFSILNTVVLGQHGNNRGYNSFEIFNKELNELTLEFKNHNLDYQKILNRNFLRYLHPFDYYFYLQKNSGRDVDFVWQDYKYLSKYSEYWLFLMPIHYLPNVLRNGFFQIYRVYIKLTKFSLIFPFRVNNTVKIVQFEK